MKADRNIPRHVSRVPSNEPERTLSKETPVESLERVRALRASSSRLATGYWHPEVIASTRLLDRHRLGSWSS